ncbi:hypothetical protein C8F04DRAFT_1197204 [Mycena alexandri]|uniref:Uncharacterized protein n=1 Tax=Mycena alexandri TaxID=1745969 RepID=A0AAD6S3P1_9AGAR|nr:hypothetical protein C8F04DRAFT_1197204 [Mycena alexandri]
MTLGEASAEKQKDFSPLSQLLPCRQICPHRQMAIRAMNKTVTSNRFKLSISPTPRHRGKYIPQPSHLTDLNPNFNRIDRESSQRYPSNPNKPSLPAVQLYRVQGFGQLVNPEKGRHHTHKPFKSTQIFACGLESYRVNGFDLFVRSNKGVYGRFNETQ